MSTNENKIFRILAVDDEQGILDSYTKILSGQTNGSESADEAMRLANKLFAENDTSEQPQEHGSEITFELTCCKQGVEAIETVQAAVETQKPFSVVFIDMRMPPGIDGIKAAEVIRDLDPNIQIVIVTGFSDIAPQHIARQVPPVDKLLYIQKPFHHQEVVQFATALSVKWKQEKLLQEINEELEKRVDERTRELVELNKELKDHSNMRTEFVVNVAHELRTPLTIFKNILSNALAGVDGKIEPKLRRNLETAVQTIDRLARVSNDFFDLSKIDVGKLNLNIKRFAIQDIITDVVSSMGHLAKEQNANIAMLMPDEELFIDADHDRIAQVLINLITNAIKFVPENTGDITVHLVDACENVEIDIEDNGPGIKKNDIDKVFNRFVQIEKHVGEGDHGTGLGLTITKEIVEMHHGKIWVESTPDHGCHFCFSLPKSQKESASSKETEQAFFTTTD